MCTETMPLLAPHLFSALHYNAKCNDGCSETYDSDYYHGDNHDALASMTKVNIMVTVTTGRRHNQAHVTNGV